MGKARPKSRRGEVNWLQTHISINQIRDQLSGISDLYYRLILLVGPSESGKTRTLREFAASEGMPVLNVGLEVSKRLLDLPERQRVLKTPEILEEIVAGLPAETKILDNTEMLFNPILKQDPLRLLRSLSRKHNIVSSWLGSSNGGHLIYAVPGHPEFRQYHVNDLFIVTVGDGNTARPGELNK
jgi:hypothetical protein